jgi:MOSC domain-containing protein YiiM
MAAGQMGENITTRGVDLLGLSNGTLLHLGKDAVVRVTGLRNPCAQLDGLQQGLMRAVLEEDDDGNVVRKAGVMAVVMRSGDVKPGESVVIEPPPRRFTHLAPAYARIHMQLPDD